MVISKPTTLVVLLPPSCSCRRQSQRHHRLGHPPLPLCWCPLRLRRVPGLARIGGRSVVRPLGPRSCSACASVVSGGGRSSSTCGCSRKQWLSTSSAEPRATSRAAFRQWSATTRGTSSRRLTTWPKQVEEESES